jgi:hypothetical protein
VVVQGDGRPERPSGDHASASASASSEFYRRKPHRSGGSFRWKNTPLGARRPTVPPLALQNWGPEIASQSSNYQELMGIYYALTTYAPVLRGKSLLLKSDNVTAVAQINKFGSAHPKLAELARAAHDVARGYSIAGRAIHVPGTSLETSATDALSQERENGNWKLDLMVYNKLEKHFGASDKRWSHHTVDCFASFANTQVPTKLFTRFPDPSHMPVGFFRQSLGSENCYINPPWNLLSRVHSFMD